MLALSEFGGVDDLGAFHSASLETAMNTPHKPHRIDVDDLDMDDEPGQMPIEPDNGLIPPLIPEDSEHDRMVDPEA